MKKSLLFLCLGISSMLIFAGCNKEEPVVEEPVVQEESAEEVTETVEEETENELDVEAESETEVEPEVEEGVPEEPEVDPNVELSMQFLEVSEDWLIENNILGLERDGQTYSLAYYVPKENRDKTGLGFYSSREDNASTYCIGDTDEDTVVMNDNFVIPVIEQNDKIYWFGKDSSSSITLLSIERYGYTVPLLLSDKYMSLILDYNNFQSNINIKSPKDNNFKVLGPDGNVCSDVRSLNQGEIYKVCWADNGDHEQEMTANVVYYKANGESITIEGQTTDDPNKVSFDLSSLPAGTYFCVESEGLFTIE